MGAGQTSRRRREARVRGTCPSWLSGVAHGKMNPRGRGSGWWRKCMRRTRRMAVRALVVLLLLQASIAMAAEALSPELLQKLAAHAARMEHLADTSVATITSDINERDSHGKLLHAIHTVAHVERAGG